MTTSTGATARQTVHMSPCRISRRTFLTGLAIAGLISRPASAESSAAKETGLSSEGLLAGHAGFQPRSVAPLNYIELAGFLSAAQLGTHHAEYRKAVENLQATEQALVTVARDPANAAAYRALRRRQVETANDVLLHEFYFGNLAPKRVAVPPYMQRQMDEHMGSVERWAADFTACALVAHTWAALVYDPYDDRWHNVVMDGDDDGVWVGANPLIVCDVAPHAYGGDYAHRDEYVTKFLDHIDWAEVAARYRRVDRM